MKANEFIEYEWEDFQNGTRGSFMKALAKAFDLADLKNLTKLVDAFPELYPFYAEFHGDVLHKNEAKTNKDISVNKFKEFVNYFDQPVDDSNVSPFKRIKETDDFVRMVAESEINEDNLEEYTFKNYKDHIEVDFEDDYGNSGHLDLDLDTLNKYLSEDDDDYLDIYTDLGESRFERDQNTGKIIGLY